MDCGFLRGLSFFDYYEVVLRFGYLLLSVVDLFVLFVLFGFGCFVVWVDFVCVFYFVYCLCVLGVCLLVWASGWLVSLVWVVFVGWVWVCDFGWFGLGLCWLFGGW